ELKPTMRRGDLVRFQLLFDQLAEAGRGLSPSQLTAAVGELAKVLASKPEGVFARLAVVAGTYVEWGGSPLALAPNAPACSIVAVWLLLAFSELWPEVGGGRPEPDPESEPTMTEMVDLFVTSSRRLDLSNRQATAIALSWFDVPHWINLMITLMARR